MRCYFKFKLGLPSPDVVNPRVHIQTRRRLVFFVGKCWCFPYGAITYRRRGTRERLFLAHRFLCLCFSSCVL